MIGDTAAIVLALTRGWLHVYTARTPPHVAAGRRAEIESDIWEMQHDDELGRGLRRGRIALARLVRGMPADIAWRLDNAAVAEQLLVRRAVALTAAALLVLSFLKLPSLFVAGQRDIATCAATAPALQTNTDLRLEVMRCAGAFFTSARR